jgi:hypothetical protein
MISLATGLTKQIARFEFLLLAYQDNYVFSWQHVSEISHRKRTSDLSILLNECKLTTKHFYSTIPAILTSLPID